MQQQQQQQLESTAIFVLRTAIPFDIEEIRSNGACEVPEVVEGFGRGVEGGIHSIWDHSISGSHD